MAEMICPQCKNSIEDDEALLCHFCGGSLNRTSGGVLGGMRGAGARWIWVTVAVVVAAAFILSMF